MSIESLKKSKLEEVRAEVKAINEDNTTYGTYEGRLDDAHAKIKYEQLLNALPEIPGLSNEDIEILEREIKQRIASLGKYRHSEYNIDTITNEEEFRKAVDRVHYQHRYDAGAMFGTLTDYEAKKDYQVLLSLLDDIYGLSNDFKAEMKALIQKKIDNIPAVETEKMEERQAYKEEFQQAFMEAKERFNSFGFFKKMKLRKEGKAPEQLNTKFLGIKEVNSLYRK